MSRSSEHAIANESRIIQLTERKTFRLLRRNTDTAQNHVDRVRVPDPSYDFGGPGRGSGWRHRSLSNIDLTSQSKHSFTKQTKGYTSGLYDLYSRLDTRKDIENTENPYGNLSPTNGESQSGVLFQLLPPPASKQKRKEKTVSRALIKQHSHYP